MENIIPIAVNYINQKIHCFPWNNFLKAFCQYTIEILILIPVHQILFKMFILVPLMKMFSGFVYLLPRKIFIFDQIFRHAFKNIFLCIFSK